MTATTDAPRIASLVPSGTDLVAALGRSDAAERLVADVRQRFASVADAVGGRPRPRVLTIEWPDPPFLGGHWVPELIAVAGGTHLLVEPGAPSRRCTWDEVIAADPDVVVLMPCGYDLHAAVTAAPKLPLDRLRARCRRRAAHRRADTDRLTTGAPAPYRQSTGNAPANHRQITGNAPAPRSG